MFFETKFEVRVTEDMGKEIDRAILIYKDRAFENRSHFGRSAIMHFLQYLKQQGDTK